MWQGKDLQVANSYVWQGKGLRAEFAPLGFARGRDVWQGKELGRSER